MISPLDLDDWGKNNFTFISADKFARHYKNQGLQLFEESTKPGASTLKENTAKFGAGSSKRFKSKSK